MRGEGDGDGVGGAGEGGGGLVEEDGVCGEGHFGLLVRGKKEGVSWRDGWKGGVGIELECGWRWGRKTEAYFFGVLLVV